MAGPLYPPRFRPLLAASVAISIGSLFAGAWVLLGRASSQTSAAVQMGSAVEAAAPKPVVGSSTIDSTWTTTLLLRNAIKQGAYAEAHRLVAAVLAQSRLQDWRYHPFDDFIDGVADVADPGFAAHLDEWVARNPREPVARLIRAQYFYAKGWYIRGHDFSNRAEPAHIAAFKDYMKKAIADIDVAIAENSDNPYPFYLKLRIVQGYGWSQKMQTAFDTAIARYPGYYPLYDIVLTTLEPRWGGRIVDMYAFVDRYAGHAPADSPLKFLYLALYRDLLNSASVFCDYDRHDKQKMPRCVASMMGKTVTPELEKQVISALQIYDHIDKYQYDLAIEEILFYMLNTTGGDAYSGAVLQLAASAMHSNTQLHEDKSGNNDYVIDEAVAQSWYVKGFYDNALKKDQEALKDIGNTTFPSDQANNTELSRVYHRMADVSGWQAYYRLKEYGDAVRACTDALENRPGNLTARYWRGMAYRDSGQTDAALRELAAVAASESGFRFNAVINMSVIYGDRHDARSELDILNSNAALYDPRIDRVEDVAIGYNNRCHAYMQLGELKKALNDCTASLRYGSLPDAYRKQQELIERLGAQKSGL